MFYWLSHFSYHYSFLNLLRYITFRSIASLLTAFAIAFLIGPPFISWMRRLQKEGQPIRLDGPETHLLTKKGTPTMGGFLILFSFFSSIFLWADLFNPYVLLLSSVFLGYGALGALDDYKKLVHKTSGGLSAGKKCIAQSMLAFCAVCGLMLVHPDPVNSVLFVPMMKEMVFYLGLLYLFFGVFVLVGTSNAVNLTDGLDGLAIGPIIVCSVVLGIFSYVSGHQIFSSYLHLPFIPGGGELAVLCAALIGAGLGFLWYNAPPALLFMGDVGSLSLGGFIGMLALILKQELLLPLVGGLFVLETLSVVLQVAYFKRTKKRIFHMAPLHHHFEKRGWSETTVVFRFWILSFLFGLLALSTLKIR